MLALLSALVALACVAASARRLIWTLAPTGVDPRMLLEAMLAEPAPWRGLRARLASGPADVAWELDLFAAWDEADAAARDAVADEQLLELRWRLRRWERVPRVCASIATSAGFLFATIVLLQGLAEPTAGAAIAREALFAALAQLAIGIAGTSFCAAVHLRVRRVVSGRHALYDRVIDVFRSAEAEAIA
jgi:hypothetical protein